MSTSARFHWLPVILAILAAEVLPIVLLIVIVVIYSLIRHDNSPTPEEFAPQAGNWVGPIGGFLAVLLCSYWVARGATSSPVGHGLAVGIGTSLIDFSLGLAMGGGGSFLTILIASNCGRILAGGLGGMLGAVRSKTT